ncbi:Electron transport complex protein RnfE [Olavius algarvensis spirochete endosymbiont]|uniref:electron transport complex subunit RsxE n=1 Tax=Olavius algarvensis spirochete endosymbiont TaxID=260710 RepID=UPI00052BCF4B|nr:electron transport complex subunit E [Olavius algarvensis spirochete endosymbiont]KGM38805.1 hypothetical protein JY97_14555 [Alkalispirochaeta odontotermitis]CAD7842139.1 MAG: Electron transport complex protein RnfE [Olavius algarvensis spirochete endosymbiont]VDB00808.1 Electron transport complex protein RnfE [Olavius algarvensis spirochete endosymbiont]
MKGLFKGLLNENPIFVLALGLCPALAVSITVSNAIGMSAATLVVLMGSNLLISLFRKQIPYDIHIPAYIVIIATLVTAVDIILQAYSPALSKSLGIFIPLIVVNCIILGRAEAFASKNTLSASFLDALSMGFGFTVGLVTIAFIRELLGSGTITLIPNGNFIRIPPLADNPVLVFSLPAGALIVMGFLQGFFRWLGVVRKR